MSNDTHLIVSLSPSLWVHRQRKPEPAAPSHLARNTDLSTLRLDELFRNRQPQPRPAMRARARLVRPPEAFKDVRQVCGGDAGTGVTDCDDNQRRLMTDRQRNPPTCGCVAQGVRQQVVQHLPDPNGIGPDRRQIVRQRDGERHPLGRRQFLEEGRNALDDRPDRHRPEIQAQLAGLGQRQLAQISDQAVQDERFVVEGRDLGLLQRVDIVQDRAQVALDHAKRRAQLVGDVGHQPAAGLLGLREIGGHGVERSGQVRYLRRPRDRRTLLQVALGNLARRCRQPAQRSRDAPGDDEPQQDAQAARDNACLQQCPVHLGQERLGGWRQVGVPVRRHEQVADRLPLPDNRQGIAQRWLRHRPACLRAGRGVHDLPLRVGQNKRRPSLAATPSASATGSRAGGGLEDRLDPVPVAMGGVILGEARHQRRLLELVLGQEAAELRARLVVGEERDDQHRRQRDESESQRQLDPESVHGALFISMMIGSQALVRLCYTGNIDFEWGDRKAEYNLQKHGVSFPEAATVFYDPLAITFADPDHLEDEDRCIVIGASTKGRLLMVAHTDRGNRIRIISARALKPKERRLYESGNENTA